MSQFLPSISGTPADNYNAMFSNNFLPVENAPTNFSTMQGWMEDKIGAGSMDNMWGNIGAFNSLANFGKMGFGIYGGLKQLGMAREQMDEAKKYASANYYTQRVLTDERRQKQAATLNSAQGRPVERPYLDNPAKLRILS